MEFDQIVGFVCGIVSGVVVYWLLIARRFERREEAQRLKLDVEAREAQLKLREEKSAFELEFKNREAELDRSIALRKEEQDLRARELARASERHAERSETLDDRETDLTRAKRALEESEHEAEKMRRLYRLKLHQISQMDQVEARKLLIATTETECEKEIRNLRQSLLKRSE